MKCIYCAADNTKVTDSRLNDVNMVRRRRECIVCNKRFTTYETIEKTPILVVKGNDSRQQFDREKIKVGIVKACEKRPVNIDQIEDIVTSIEKEIHNKMKKEIDAKEIGEMVMQKLKNVDKIAYIRFASVYKQFEDISNFKEILKEL